MKLLSSNLSVDKTFVSLLCCNWWFCLRDLLKEFDSVSLFPIEFRLIKEHRGLFDLKSSLFLAPSPETTDLAIKDFQWLCRISPEVGLVSTVQDIPMIIIQVMSF